MGNLHANCLGFVSGSCWALHPARSSIHNHRGPEVLEYHARGLVPSADSGSTSTRPKTNSRVGSRGLWENQLPARGAFDSISKRAMWSASIGSMLVSQKAAWIPRLGMLALDLGPAPLFFPSSRNISSAHGICTPVPPPPNDLQYLRTLPLGLNKEDFRTSIPEWEYWRAEAQFFAKRVQGAKRSARAVGTIIVGRRKLRFGRQNVCRLMRLQIGINLPISSTGNAGLFQASTEAYEPSAQTASQPPLSSLPPPTACLDRRTRNLSST